MFTGLLQHLPNLPGWAVLMAVGLVVFAEDALFVGLFLPGETHAVLGRVAARLGPVPLRPAGRRSCGRGRRA